MTSGHVEPDWDQVRREVVAGYLVAAVELEDDGDAEQAAVVRGHARSLLLDAEPRP